MVDSRYTWKVELVGCPDQLSVGYERKKGSRFWTSATTRKEFLITHMGKEIFAKYWCIHR